MTRRMLLAVALLALVGRGVINADFVGELKLEHIVASTSLIL